MKNMRFFHNLLIIGTIMYSQTTLLLWDLVRDKNPFYTSFFNIEPWVWSVAPIYLSIQTFFYLIIPGDKILGPVTPEGNRPEYKDNGIESWFLTFLLTYFVSFYIDYSEYFDYIGDFQKTLNVYGMLLISIFFIRSKITSVKKLNEPKFNDNSLQDFYKGVELHPTFTSYNLPLKLLINSRFGMSVWGVICLMSLLSNTHQLNILVSNILQLIYITKFFIWEKGYVYSMDITQDRTGYYLLWGCICYLPTVYTLPTVYHHYHNDQNSYIFYLSSLSLGLLSIYLNWRVDEQRSEYRNIIENKTEGYQKLKYITSTYKTSDERFRISYLVYSGFLGLAFHMNYLFEILSTFFWTVPGVFPNNIYAYIYLVFLTVLLIHRVERDDQKCSLKYGNKWKEYRQKVPYNIIPYIY